MFKGTAIGDSATVALLAVTIIAGLSGMTITSPDGAEELGILLRPQVAAPIHVMENLWCRPRQDSSFRVISAKERNKPFMWLMAVRPGETVECFTNSERTLPQSGAEPKTFYLESSKAEHQKYMLVPDRSFFEVSKVSPGQYRIRLNSVEQIWPAIVQESLKVQGALKDLWRRDLLDPFMVAEEREFRWRGKDGAELSGRRWPVSADAIILEAPFSWLGGELTFLIGNKLLRWQIEGVTTPKIEPPVPGRSEMLKDQPKTKRSVLGIVVISAISLVFIVVLIQVLFQLPWDRLLNFRRRSRSLRQQSPRSEHYYGSGIGQASSADLDRQTDLAVRVLQIEEQLRNLVERVQEQTIRHHQMNESLLERFDRLEKWVDARNVSGIHQPPPPVSPVPSMQVLGAGRRVEFGALPSGDPEKVAFELLDLIEPGGRGAPLARLPELTDWLRKNHPGIEAESIGGLNRDLWLLLVLTADGKTGVVVPALDSIIGPGEALKWFEGGRYDATQALVRANILSLGMAARDPETQTWRPRSKGKIDLT